MTDDDRTIPLSDVAPERARRENDMIDEQFEQLEQRIATLEDEVDQKESKLEDERSTREDLQNVVAQYRQNRADELRADISDTIASAAVSEDDFDFDIEDLEDADVDTLKTVKSMVDTTIEAAGINPANPGQQVSNQGTKPDLGSVEDETGPDISEVAQQAADDLGMGQTWEKMQAGEKLAEPKHLDLGSTGSGSAKEELAELLAEVNSE